jgi:threonyl-tRNA synthetase
MGSLVNGIKPRVITEHRGRISYNENPMKYLIQMDLAIQVGNGLFVLKGKLVDILDKVDILMHMIAKNVKAEEAFVPSVLSWDNAQRSEYLNSFKHQALVVKNLEDSKTEGLACPTVCYHYSGSLKDKVVDRDFCVTAVSRCTRKEEGKLDDLSRLTNFTMREVACYGSEKYCSDKLKETLNETMKVLDTVFDLDYKVITAADPFFGSDGDMKQKAQLILESKYEIQATLPYNKSGVSIASFNNHGKVFFKRFRIKPGKPELSFSSCVGWGYERILFTILAQKGVNFNTTYYKRLLGK